MPLRRFGSALLAAALLACVQSAAAQTPKAVMPPQKATAKKSATLRAHRAVKAKHKIEKPVTIAEKPAPPPAPPKPNWPVDEAPAAPTVTWDSHGLRVKAANASLRQILSDISTQTGAKVEGLEQDQRVFGEFGPAPARDVLSQILHGSGYNVLMIGDQGEGTPRVIVLSARNESTAPQNQASARPQPEEEEPEPPQQQEPVVSPTMNRPMGVPINQPPPLTPQQQFMQMQQRQQEMLRQNQPQQ